MPRYSAVTTALAWTAFNFAIGALRREKRIRYMLLRYEDLTERPRQSVSQVCELVGVEPGDLGFIEDNAVRLRPNHTVSRNPSRFRHGRIPVRQDTSWRSSVPSAQRALGAALTLYHSRQYGYTSRHDQPRTSASPHAPRTQPPDVPKPALRPLNRASTR